MKSIENKSKIKYRGEMLQGRNLRPSFNCLLFGPKSFTGKLHYLAEMYSQANCVITPKLIHRQNHYLAKINSQMKYPV
jgi:hypothetical protein